MSRRHLLVWIGTFVSGGLAFLGVLIFAVAMAAELFGSRDAGVGVSPTVQLGLAGLCLSSVMFLLLFGLVALLLARQTRERGSGYADAYRLIESFRFGEAIPLLERSIQEGKETSDVLMLLTSAYAYSGQLAKAQAAADRAVQLFPNDASAYVTLSNGYRLQAAYEEAAGALQKATELTPSQPVIWAELGFVQKFAGNDAEAVEAFKEAAKHAMSAMYAVRVYYHLAQAYEAAGDTKEAVSATAKLMSARSGLAAWKSGLNALEGTAYGQTLRYEIAAIEQALADADAGNLG